MQHTAITATHAEATGAAPALAAGRQVSAAAQLQRRLGNQGVLRLRERSRATLRRKCSCGAGAGGECAACKGEEEAVLQRRAAGPAEATAPPIVHEVLRSPGRPLDGATRAAMEGQFGHGFGDVRVHTDAKAAASARAVQALAYTVGRDVVFGAGQYAPGTAAGKGLLAHELAHVVQQGTAAVPAAGLRVGGVNDASEREAEAAAGGPQSSPAASAGVPPLLAPSPEAVLRRSPLFTSTMEICKRVLKSRTFKVSEGGVVVTADARWQASEEWEGTEPPQCGRPAYHITLTQEGTIFDHDYGDCEFQHGVPVTRTWTEIPEDDYYLTIWTNNTNPNCCLRGSIEVSQEKGLGGPTCTKPPPGPLEILHFALDVAGLIPALGVVPDLINAGIYVVEGDYVSAGISALAMIPIFGEGAIIAKRAGKEVVQVSGDVIRRLGREEISAGLKEAKALRRAEREGLEEAGRALKQESRAVAGAGKRLAGLARCRAGSLFCPLDFLREEFADLFAARRGAEFSRFVREIPEVDLNMARSLRRELQIPSGEAMYVQFLEEVSPRQWSEPFRDALGAGQRAGRDFREIRVGDRTFRWPLDDVGNPWVVHHDPPLIWVPAESNQWWHPMPYRVHLDAHDWWRQLEREVKARIPPDLRKEILEAEIDIRELAK